MDIKELKTKSAGEIQKMLGELRTQANDLKAKLKMNELKTNHQLQVVKKDIARILTYLNTKQD